MKITIYTITDCKFSNQEKEYLTANKLAFEEKNLETNREFLTEMLAVSNNFAGTPVTKIEKDDNQIVVLKGFTKEEFDKTLGLGVQPAPAQPAEAVAPTPPPVTAEAPAQPVPVAVVEPPAPAPVEVPQAAPPAPVPEAPAAPAQPDPMADILTSLEQQANAAPAAQAPAPAAPASGMPSIPDPKL